MSPTQVSHSLKPLPSFGNAANCRTPDIGLSDKNQGIAANVSGQWGTTVAPTGQFKPKQGLNLPGGRANGKTDTKCLIVGRRAIY